MSEEREEFLKGLGKSKNIVGHIYPVIVNKKTLTIVDGKHRKQIDPAWPEKQIEFPDKKSEILFRMHANYRRKVSRKERQAEMLMLASILEEEGTTREQMVSKLAENTPFSEQYIRSLLPSKYKVTEKKHKSVHKRTELDEKLVSHPKIVAEATEIVTPPEPATHETETVEKPQPSVPVEEEKTFEAIAEKPKSKPKPAIPNVLQCPRCKVEVKTLYCTKCFSELKVKEIAKILRRLILG